jgi:dihydrofolate reductase
MKAMIAISKNVIGNGNGLPWKNKEDLSRFAMQTKDKNLVMGYNTFMSLPEINGVKLKGRTLHVLINEGTNIELPDYVIGITLDVLKDYHCCGLINDYICIGGMKTLNLLYDEGLISEADITWIFKLAKSICICFLK